MKNAIDSLFVLQQADGRLPWAGTPFTGPGRFIFSYTYHLYTLLDLYYYYTYTGDLAYLNSYWSQYKLALNWSLGTIDSSGMGNVSSSNDWLRSGMAGHNIEVRSQMAVMFLSYILIPLITGKFDLLSYVRYKS
jgi:hypothetical protein